MERMEPPGATQNGTASRLGAAGRTARNGFADLAWPSNVALETAIAVLDDSKACLERHEKNPKPAGKKGHRPRDEPEKQEPKDREARVTSHDDAEKVDVVESRHLRRRAAPWIILCSRSP